MEKLVKWNDEFSVGYAKIDDQHKMMLELLNKLFFIFGKGMERQEFLKILKETNDYAAMHFSFEEALMTGAGYPGLEAHLAVHERYRLEVRRFVTELVRDDRVSPEELFQFLKNWWRGHILNTDSAYSPYVAGFAPPRED